MKSEFSKFYQSKEGLQVRYEKLSMKNQLLKQEIVENNLMMLDLKERIRIFEEKQEREPKRVDITHASVDLSPDDPLYEKS
jgi:hypothetical protein